MLGTIELSEDENAVAGKIALATRELPDLPDHERAIETGRLSSVLFKQILRRKGFPDTRLRYFVDPLMNGNNTRSSRKDIFLRNAGTEENMYTHPHFWSYLLYFIHGPALPQLVKQEFQIEANNTFRDWDALRKIARRQSRQMTGSKTTKAELFLQLALDCGCDISEAMNVRDAVMKS